MKPYDEAWFDRLYESISSFAVPRLPLSDLVHASWLGLDELAFGYRLGFVSPSAAVEASLNRLRGGYAQSDTQVEIALTLRDNLEGVEQSLRSHPLDGVATRAEALWLYCTLSLCYRRWASAPTADIRLEFPEVLAYWTSSAADPWRSLTVTRPSIRVRHGTLMERLRAALQSEATRYLEPPV